ncbi:hypothetical protein I4U23_006811 [Adineta vaga]|nr:hypothetical protein I4U23_006811 [Adineta vaga]
MHVILFLIICLTLVNGNCNFPSKETQVLQDKMKNWGIYKKIYSVTSQTSTYQIGICLSLNNSISDTAILQKEKNESFILGQVNQSNLIGTDQWLLLTYKNGSQYKNICNNKTRSAWIIFICGQTLGRITVIEETCNYVFEFQLPGLCSSMPVTKKSMSGSAIFFIILLCLASSYLIGGFFYMRIKHGARGIDQIPNLDMWRQIGNFIAEKCPFCRFCQTNTSQTGYLFQDTGADLHGDDDILAP